MRLLKEQGLDELDYWVIFHDKKLLLHEQDGVWSLPCFRDIAEYKNYLKFIHGLGMFQGGECFCAELMQEVQLEGRFQFFPTRQAFELLSNDWYALITKGIHTVDWDKNHQFCGLCGAKTKLFTTIFEAHCDSCKTIFYPRISPSIIVLIRKENQILMARSPHFPKGVYGLIAGFVSPGETLEDTVHREVAEEVGIKVKNIRYYGSQPWPFPDSLMLAFIADYDSGDIIIDGVEIEAAGWYDVANLPGMPSSSKSIAKVMIDDFIAGELRFS